MNAVAAPATLVLLSKRPSLGVGKQRLAATIGAEKAFQINSLLVQCALDLLNSWQGPKILAVHCQEDQDWAFSICGKGEVLVQPPGNLGEKIAALDSQLRGSGHQRILWIGSDCPALALPDLEAANQQLDRHPYGFHAAMDGGAVLMANSRAWPPLADLPWSTNQFLSEIAKVCTIPDGPPLIQTPALPDLDLAEDLAPVLGTIQNTTSEAGLALKRCLEEWLEHERHRELNGSDLAKDVSSHLEQAVYSGGVQLDQKLQ